MKLLVIGHSVVDRIKFKGEVKLKPGGIHYSIAALSSFKTGKDEINKMLTELGASEVNEKNFE